MEQFIGVKRVNAKAMTRGEYNAFRGWELPADENGADEGYLVEYQDGGKANTAEYAGYVSWSPRDVFERAYRPVGARVGFSANREVAAFLRDVADRVMVSDQGAEMAVVIYGTYGGVFHVESTVSGVEALGVMALGERTMSDAIVRPLVEKAPVLTEADSLADLNGEPRPNNPTI
ncbi:hypothetical protein [Burkholderia mayonis]|uniref:hypothetical protein n=1 Tax=Burkholderia mayonis TaxID=1385591 RepID=UPI000AC00A74|nr:hypothetical protein [Burkholderia mayonis]